MRGAAIVLSFLTALGLLVSCREDTPWAPPPVDAELAFSLVEKIVQAGPRPSGGENIEKVARLIADTAREMGAAKVEVDEFQDETPRGVMTFRNIEAVVPGESDRFVVIGGHYDSKALASTPDFAGANDGGSSSGLLLAMTKAAASSGRKPRVTLKFVFFDGEECLVNYGPRDGLHGSRRYVRRLQENGLVGKCAAMILLDMVGDKDLCVTIPQGCASGLRRLFLDSASARGGLPARAHDSAMLDDHTPFLEAGIPALDIIDFEYGRGNMYWHTSEDTMDKISAKSLGLVGDTVLEMISRGGSFRR